jgi:hypothetical protein
MLDSPRFEWDEATVDEARGVASHICIDHDPYGAAWLGRLADAGLLRPELRDLIAVALARKQAAQAVTAQARPGEERAYCPRHGWFDVAEGGCEPCQEQALAAQEQDATTRRDGLVPWTGPAVADDDDLAIEERLEREHFDFGDGPDGWWPE